MRRSLPPLVVHPEVHAAGELRWHRLENHLARQCESGLRRAAVRVMLAARARVQKRHLRDADRVICPSARFAQLVARDYGLDTDRLGVIPNPIDLAGISPGDGHRDEGAPQVLFVSRISVRKGVEDVVWLSHRLRDTGATLHIVGGGSLWSDYRPLLRDLDPAVARYEGGIEPAQVLDRYRAATVVIQPSRYEPFALTVGEALAAGTPVVASDEVGATEFVDGPACLRYPAGDPARLEAAVREMIARSRADPEGLRREARAQAERAFAPGVVAGALMEQLERVVAAAPHARRWSRLAAQSASPARGSFETRYSGRHR
jgi:glycosyltransferase involved in cell wall biosynthesis